MSLKFKTLAVFLLVFPVICSAANYNIKAGMWESKSKINKITGVPKEMQSMMGIGREMVEQVCSNGSGNIFFASNPDDECKIKRTRINANKMKVTMNCTAPDGPSSAKGELNYRGTAVDGWLEVTIPKGPTGPMTMKHVVSGKYIGKCK